ncbi:MAG: phosphatase PAP2 family protein [Gaiellaceae bacterium]
MHHRWHPLDGVFVWLSKLGTWGAVWLALGLLVALAQRRALPLLLVGSADAVAQGVSAVLKAITGIERPAYRDPTPPPLLHVPHDGSFPSGHTTSSFACAAVLASLVPRAASAFTLLALAIGFSRIYVGAHWPLDVAGGILLGVATALLLLAAVRRRSASPRPRG